MAGYGAAQLAACRRAKELPLLFRDNSQLRHPDQCHVHGVVVVAEVGLVAGDHPVGTRLERRRVEDRAHGDVFVPLLVVVGRGQVDLPLAHGCQAEDCLSIGVVQPPRMGFSGCQPALPIGLRDPQMHRGEIPVADADRRPRRGPGSLSLDREVFGLNLRDEVFAEYAAWARGVGFGPRYRQGTRLHEIVVAVILLQEAGEVEAGKRGGLVVARPFDEGFEGGSLTGCEIGGITTRDRRAAGPEDAVEVGGQKGRAIGVSAMKLKQAAVEPYYF